MFKQLILIAILASLAIEVTSEESNLEIQLICPGVNSITLFYVADSEKTKLECLPWKCFPGKSSFGK